MLQDLILNTDLNDVWRLQHEDQREYTWSRNNPFIARRLDYIFTSSALLPYVESSEIKSIPFSEHRLVKIEINFNQFKKGSSDWKFNDNLLTDTEYTDQTSALLDKITKEQDELGNLNPHNAWELIKLKSKNTRHLIQHRKTSKGKTLKRNC